MFYAPGLNGLPRASSSRIVCQSVCLSIVLLKPQSDIHCNPSATYPTKIHNDRRGRRGVATRFCSLSATDWGLVAEWSATSWGPLCDLMQLVADRSGVADLSPISGRSVADQLNLNV